MCEPRLYGMDEAGGTHGKIENMVPVYVMFREGTPLTSSDIFRTVREIVHKNL
ncbi:hypothetical protein CUROG_10245 [Corynebacterium urogenitale]|uniref:Uncharacterized protein n=1 Tax=Corynebacterium urogenitale TaxID=2487892 RepID=A0A5J6ZAS6_9CORY|nr:hypothetical protein CUROG_10245 [Corynebacterium urogenitale]